jgi:glycerate dehydrogenase
MVDLAACKRHGVIVSNVPAASNESVAEQAIALYFALRRNVIRMHDLTAMGSLWTQKMTLKAEFGDCPRTCRQEIAGILGGGELGMSDPSPTVILDIVILPLSLSCFSCLQPP